MHEAEEEHTLVGEKRRGTERRQLLSAARFECDMRQERMIRMMKPFSEMRQEKDETTYET